jgi:hypothetical protein
MAAALGNVYVTGGRSGSNVLGDVKFTAALGAATGNFKTNPNSFTPARQNHALVQAGGRLYVIGGATDAAGTTATTSIQVATLVTTGTAAGSTGPFSAARDLPAGRTGAAAVVLKGRLYVIGGEVAGAPSGTVLVSTIAADGSLGAWDTSSVALGTARTRHAAFAYGGRLYVLGGSDGTNPLGDVQVGTIGAGGAVTGWTSTSAFTPARSGFAAFAHDGVVALLGGAGAENDVQVAKIYADGSLDPWVAGTPLPTSTPSNLGRSDFGAAYAEGALYVTGGVRAGTQQDSVTVGSFNLPAARGAWSKLFDLGAPLTVASVTIDGTLSPQGSLKLEYESAGTDGQYGARVTVETLQAGAAVPLNLTATRYLWLRLTLDDTLSAIGDSLVTSDETVITKVTVTAASNPPAKLVVATNPLTLTAGACSAAITLQLQDTGSQPALAAADVLVSASSTPAAGLALFSDSGCATPATGATVPAGSATATLYLKGTVAGAYTLNFTTAGLGAASQQAIINAGAATKLGFLTQPTTTVLGAKIVPPIQIGIQDALGNLVTSATTAVELREPNDASAISAGTAQIASAGIATFSAVVTNKTGTFSLAANSLGSPTLATATSGTFTVIPPSAATKLAFLTTAQSVVVGQCSAKATVQAQDAAGTPATQPSPLNVGLAGTNLTFYADAACTSSLTSVNIAANQSAAKADFYVKSNTLGAATVTAHSNGQPLTDATQDWEFTALATGNDGGPDGGDQPDGGSGAGPGVVKGINGFSCASGGAGPQALLPLLAGLLLVPALRRRRSARALARGTGALLLGLVGVLCSAAGAAEQKGQPARPVINAVQPIIAVIDFEKSQLIKDAEKLPNAEKIDRYYLADTVRGVVVAELPASKVMTKELNEQMLGASGQSLESCEGLCAIETGKKLGADYVISGDITRFGTTLKLVLKLHVVAGGNLVGSAQAEGQTLNELDRSLKPAVKDLVRPLVLQAQTQAKAEEEARAQSQAERVAAAQAAAAVRAKEEAHQEALERAKKDGELSAAKRRGEELAKPYYPWFGLYGGAVYDLREKSLGYEAGLDLRASFVTIDLGATIAEHVGVRAAVWVPAPLGTQLGGRLLVTPLDGGTLVAGGAGLRKGFSLSGSLHLRLGVAAEYYKFPSASQFGVLATAGLDFMLF